MQQVVPYEAVAQGRERRMIDPRDIPAPRTIDDLAKAAKLLGVPKKELLVLDPSNDPFNVGTPAKVRDAEWFTSLWERFGNRGVHNRRIHYIAQSTGDVLMPNGETYVNTESCWRTLEKASKYARDLALVDPELLADKRNAESRLYAPGQREQEPHPYTQVQIDGSPLRSYNAWQLPSIDPDDLTLYGFDVGDAQVYDYDYHPDDQPFLVELWIEKSTMDDVLSPLCRNLNANYTPGTGFTSKTRVAQMLRRAQWSGKPVRIFVISDFDPAGADMPSSIARNVEFYRDRIAPDVEFKLHHVGMTHEWAERYDLPRAPIKDDDKRKDNFERLHGEGCVELDALEALHPGALAREIRAEITPYIDLEFARTLRAVESEAEQAAQAAWHATTATLRADLGEIEDQVRDVADRYRDRLTDLGAELERDLAPHRERLGDLWARLVDLAGDPTPNLPGRPVPSPAGRDESAWLYDSGRHWLDQLKRYRAEKAEHVE